MMIDSAASLSSSSSSTLSSSHASSFPSLSDDEVESDLCDQDSSSDQPRLLSYIRCSSCNGEDIQSDTLSRWLACEDDKCDRWFHANCLGILPSRWQETEDSDEHGFVIFIDICICKGEGLHNNWVMTLTCLLPREWYQAKYVLVLIVTSCCFLHVPHWTALRDCFSFMFFVAVQFSIFL